VIKSRRTRWVGHVALPPGDNPIAVNKYYYYYMAERIGAYRILERRPEGRRHLGIRKHRWQHNIKMDLQDVGWGTWTGLIWLRRGTGAGIFVNEVMNFLVPYNAWNFFTSFSRRPCSMELV